MILRIVIVAALLLLFFYGNFFIVQKGIFVSRVTQTFALPILLIKTLFIGANNYQEFIALNLENENLKSQISQLKNSAKILSGGDHRKLLVKIYSTYPLNNQSRITINAGRRAGIKELAPVTAGENILFGQVLEVFDDYSVTRTIFDADWRLSVKIGDERITALMVGGLLPRLTMIAKDKVLENGQEVYSVGKDFPYGIKLGEVKNIKTAPTEVFQEAELDLSYNFSDLDELYAHD